MPPPPRQNSEALRGLSKAEADQMWFPATSGSLKTTKGSSKEAHSKECEEGWAGQREASGSISLALVVRESSGARDFQRH